MTPDRELWACALTLRARYGAAAAARASESVEALLARGDEAGARSWRGIVSRIERLGLAPEGAVTDPIVGHGPATR